MIATTQVSTATLAFCRDPIFIIGAPRSGTSILASSLGQHSALWYSTEANFLPALFGRLDLHEIHARATHWLDKEGVPREEFLESLGLGINALFTSRSGGRRWIEKTPRNTLIVNVLAAVFPDACFLHVLRDGRRVAHSMVHFLNAVPERTKAKWDAFDCAPRWCSDFRLACRTWQEYVDAALAFAVSRPSQCLTIRYEKLLADPQQSFAKVFEFLGVSHEAAPAAFLRSRRINSSFQRGSVGPPPADFLSDPWQRWTLEQRQTFLEEAGTMMVRCGLLTADQLRELETDAGVPIDGLSVRVQEDGSTVRYATGFCQSSVANTVST